MMFKLLLAANFLFSSAPANAVPVYAWPLMNGPNGAPPTPTAAEIAAQQAAQQAQMAAYQEALQQEQARQAEGGTGNNELANSFGNMMPGGGGMGTQSIRTANGNGLDVSGPSGTSSSGSPNYFINGCSEQEGKFQLKMVSEKSDVKCSSPESCSQKPEGCDRQVEINEMLANMISNHFNRCVQESIHAATGRVEPIQKGKIFNVGIMGDARHRAGGSSLHNHGLAMDVRAIEVNGRTYVYENTDSQSRAFFDKFRKCWGAAVEKERAGCLTGRASGMPHGTIGREDDRHHHHLHLSLPYCTAEARAKGMNIAWLRLIVPEAFAAPQLIKENFKQMTYKTSLIKAAKGEVKVTVMDGHGEPVAADHTIKLEVACKKKLKIAAAAIEIDACGFTETKYDAKLDAITVRYMTSDLVSGRVSCRLSKSRTYKLPCD